MALNPSSPIPLYRQLADRLLADIDAGEYRDNEKIPSENDLADHFKIGRPTVRQATDWLVRRGHLERRRGSGTFVRSPAASIDVLSLAGTSAAFTSPDLDGHLELISGAVLDSAHTSKRATYRVQRRALVDQTPVLLETLNFDAEVFPGLDKHSLMQRSLSSLVKDVYFLEPLSANQAFSVCLADVEHARFLSVPSKTALLHVRRTLHFENNRDALHAEIVCRTDRFDFSQTLFPTRTS